MPYIQSCFSPNSFINPYTGDKVTAKCGKCDACRNKRAEEWVRRLDMESDCHKYTYFFTLTYDDLHVNQIVKLPYEYKNRNSFQFLDSESDEIFDTFDVREEFRPKDVEYCRDSEYLNVLSKRDFQLFFKRLRYYFNQTEKGALLRYYICGEYGPQTFRPHGHCLLFFDSSRCADRICELLSKAWSNEYGESLGNIYDPHPVSGSAAEYCASYINSSSVLPRVYLHKGLRPFTLFSKCPAIGSLYPNVKEVRKVFDSGDIKFRRYDKTSNSFKDDFFWRSYEDRLFPRCQRFSSLVSSDRVALYRKILEFPSHLTAREIAQRIKAEYIDSGRKDFFGRYFREISYKKSKGVHFVTQDLDLPYKFKVLPFLPKDFLLERPFNAVKSEIKEYNEDSLIRFVTVVNRVRHQAAAFGVSIDYYVHKIENYYDKKSYQRLKDDYTFQDGYFKHHPSWHIIYFDKGFYDRVINTEYSVLSKETQKYLSFLFGGNVPLKRSYCPDGKVSLTLDIPSLETLDDYRNFFLLHKKIAHDLVKQKQNNDYVLSKGSNYQNIKNYHLNN